MMFVRNKSYVPLKRDNYQDSYPFPRNPNGWYGVCTSSELKRNRSLPLSYFGKEFVAFRGSNGEACVADPYCPHFGAHLGRSNAKVIKGELQCPFHQWRFNTAGQCTQAPHSACTPRGPRSRLKTYPVKELNGIVFMWYHAANKAPEYSPPELPELFGNDWMPTKNFSVEFRTHIQELRENFCDETHFVYMHDQPDPSGIEFEAQGPLATTKSQLIWNLFNKLGLAKMFTFGSTATMYGPGLMVVRVSGWFNIMAIALTTPVDEHITEMRFFTTAKRKKYLPLFGRLLHFIFRTVAYNDLKKEGNIWNHKVYQEKPIFQAHERAIKKFRPWYQQFYEEQTESEHKEQVVPLKIVRTHLKNG